MISSMTGYGRSEYSANHIKIVVEIKSINSKQFDLTLRMPSRFRDQEPALRGMLSGLLERGKVEISVTYDNMEELSPMLINFGVIEAYKNQLSALADELEVEEPKDWIPLLIRLPEVLRPRDTEASATDTESLRRAILDAVSQLKESRLKEGRGLYKFFFEKIERIREYLSYTEKFETGRIEKIREKLNAQLSKLQGIEIDRGRLEQELIFYIEKLDVAEEKQRLKSHLQYFEETLGDPDDPGTDGKGKKLGFISQEIGREINTLGSKSNDAEMQRLVVMMKDELEQIKEQVLNVL